MIPKECKRLAEVDFPIAVVSKHSAREKSIRHGHPSTLHLWWARRPLAACRAMLLGLLLPDPCDPHCPEDFKEKARSLLPTVQGEVGPTDKDLRKSLLKFIGDFANWDLSVNQTWLDIGRGLVKAAHPEETPLVVDPFAGGGSIPLEALRLGCETFASDLNPVACLILKVMLEDIPRYVPALADELRKVGQQIKEEAEKELAEFYPTDPDGSRPIAYLWARTVKCESPNCGAEIPLVRSFWLAKKAGKRRALKYRILQDNNQSPEISFEIIRPTHDTDVQAGTTNNGRGICPACNTVLSSARLQAQLTEQQGGAKNPRLLAVVTVKEDQDGREYRLPTSKDLECITRAQEILSRKNFRLTETLSPVRPSPNARGVSAPTRYGVTTFENLFLPRQMLALATFAQNISQIGSSNEIRRLLSLALDKMAMQCNAHCRWKSTGESLVDMFGRHAISMVWDFAESVPLATGTGSWDAAIKWLQSAIKGISKISIKKGQASNEDACESPLPDKSVHTWFTDPPYYDNIPYADLSDFFFVWLNRVLRADPLFSHSIKNENSLTPKLKEAVWNHAHIVDGKPKGPEFFERAIAKASREGKRVLLDSGLGCIVFAHKTTEGWEALLSGMIDAGWVITASWPIDTEMATRVSARDSASLSTSVHLVCRPRPEDASIGDWGDVLRELPHRVGDWMERLQSEGIRGADLVFACIGPALEIFSRYSKVETAEGRQVKLAEYLEKVWEVVGRTALEQVLGTEAAKARNGAAGAVEEDARLTALFLWTLQSTNGEEVKSEKEKGKSEEIEEEEIDEDEDTPKGKQKGFSLVFDVVRRFAQPLGIHLPEWEGRIIETKKGVVRLFSIAERAKQLFGEDGAQAIADKLESSTEESPQLTLFAGNQEGAAPQIKGRSRQRKTGVSVSEESLKEHHGATTLDRVHAAMLLQASGRANALRALLKAEIERSSDFLRLSNALSALYPKGSEEKRLLDAMLLAVPR